MRKKISNRIIAFYLLVIFLALSCADQDGDHSKTLPFDLLESINGCSGATWGENSKTIFYTADGSLWQHSITDNSKTKIAGLEGVGGTPQMSFDYSRLAILKDGEIWIIRREDQLVEKKIEGDIRSGWDLNTDATGVLFSGEGNIWSEVSETGDHAYVKKSEEWFGVNELYVNDKLIEKEEGILWLFSPYASPIEWSGDGERLYFISARSGWSKIFSVNKKGEDIRQETFGMGDDRDLNILTDGSMLFVSNRNLHVEWSLWMKRPGQEAECLFGKNGFVRSVSVSPDEKWVSFLYSTPAQPFELYALNLDSGDLIQLSKNTPEDLENFIIQPEVISYMSGDREVQGILYLPDTTITESPVPAIVKLHGGPSMHDGLNWKGSVQYFASRGYAVLIVNYTGSVGYGKAFEEENFYSIGKEDCDDVAAAAAFLKTLEEPEIGKIGVTGSSYGGYLTNLVIGRYPDLFDVGVSWFGISNWNTLFEFERLNLVVRTFFLNRLGTRDQYADLYNFASPVTYADSIMTPLLIMHGDLDTIVPYGQSQEFNELLNQKGKVVDLIKYEDEGHGWSRKETRADAYRRMEEWFERYLR
jgi:dipeptidyl aminopeptidase/acylaminoacyl peptidase